MRLSTWSFNEYAIKTRSLSQTSPFWKTCTSSPGCSKNFLKSPKHETLTAFFFGLLGSAIFQHKNFWPFIWWDAILSHFLQSLSRRQPLTVRVCMQSLHTVWVPFFSMFSCCFHVQHCVSSGAEAPHLCARLAQIASTNQATLTCHKTSFSLEAAFTWWIQTIFSYFA